MIAKQYMTLITAYQNNGQSTHKTQTMGAKMNRIQDLYFELSAQIGAHIEAYIIL